MFKQSILWLAAVLFIGLSSCGDVDNEPVLRLGAASAITTPDDGASFVITEENLGQVMTTFSWNAADFGVATGVNYVLEADLAGNNFADPIRLIPSTSATSGEVINNTINNFLLGRDVAAGTPTEILVRVRASVGRADDGNASTSEAISLIVTPFEAERTFPTYYVPGEYQGWSPGADNVGRIYSVDDNGIYRGFVNFGDMGSPFKITDQPNWDNGIFGASAEAGVLASPGDNLVSTGTGLHLLEFDVNQLTFTQTATEWGIIGDGTPTGWGSDTDFVYDAATQTLMVTLDLTAGTNGDGNPLAFKLRANDAWDLDYGDNDGDGKLDFKGGNIPVPETGNYTVTVTFETAIPTYTLTKN